MNEYIFSVITACISGIVTYFIARNGNKKDIEIVKIQNKADMDKLINQHKIDINAMKEKHKLELELKEIEQKYKVEILKLENENEIKKATKITNNEAINSATNQIFGTIFNKESVQGQLDGIIKEAFDKANVENKDEEK